MGKPDLGDDDEGGTGKDGLNGVAEEVVEEGTEEGKVSPASRLFGGVTFVDACIGFQTQSGPPMNSDRGRVILRDFNGNTVSSKSLYCNLSPL